MFTGSQKAVHDAEYLLHHSVLAQVVFSFHQLGAVPTVRAQAFDSFGGVYAAHIIECFIKAMDA